MKRQIFFVVFLIVLISGSLSVVAQDGEAPEILLVTNDEWLDGDQTILEKFEELGYSVTMANHDEVDSSWVDGVDLVYVSSTVSSGSVADKFKNVEVPVLMIEPYALDDMGMSLDTDTTRFFQAFQRDMEILEEGHFLAAGLTGEIFVFDDLEIQSAQGYPSEEGVVIAEYIRDDTDVNMIYGAIYAYEKGALMADTTEAPERRYFAGWNDMGVAFLTEDGWKLWQASIDWCLYKDQDSAVKQEAERHPVAFGLAQNFPNPFNPTTMIEFSLPAKMRVRLSVFDLQGREVARLTDGFTEAGSTRILFDASDLASGIYFYQLKTEQFTETRKMTILE